MSEHGDVWGLLLKLASAVIATLAGVVVYLVAWIRHLYTEARTDQASEVRERDQRHEKLLEIIERMQKQIESHAPSRKRDET